MPKLSKPKPAKPPPGGRRPGAGRKPGSRNKATRAREEAAQRTVSTVLERLNMDTSNFTPLECLLLCMHVKLQAGDLSGAAAAAREAAPYCHPKVATSVPSPVTPEDLMSDPPATPDE